MWKPGKKPLKNKILLTVLILLAGAGVTFAALQAERTKFGTPANAAAPSSRLAAPASSSSKAQPEPEAKTVLLEQAAKPLKVEVSLKEQKVSVFDAKNRMVREYVCSSGETGSETPTGTFTVTDRGKSFFNPKVGEGAYYWTRFYKTYLFHSVPFDEGRKMEPEEAAKLGTPASHGCIRLPVEDAKWIYDHIPEGTQVVVR